MRIEPLMCIDRYMKYVEQIGDVVMKKFDPIIDYMYQLDPHDLITPDTYFSSNNEAIGFVFGLFINFCKKSKIIK